MGRVSIHCEPKIAWQGPFAERMRRGLCAIGVNAEITNNRGRETDVAVLLGTTCWTYIEQTGNYLLVDRASVGDPDYVQLVWNGHGRRGDHCVPEDTGDRWDKMNVTVYPWTTGGKRVVLCGQTATFSPHYADPAEWYAKVSATHFRRHPAGDNPTGLPNQTDWADVGRVVTLNSSVGVESVLTGIPTVTMDEAAMAWDVSSHDPEVSITPYRSRWMRWLAWTQWRHDEIEAGTPIKHLFERVL